MKRILFTMAALALVVGLTIPAVMPAAASPDTLTIYSDETVQIIGVYNKALGGSSFVDLSGSPMGAVRAWEPKPYPTGYPPEPPETRDSVWDSGTSKFFQPADTTAPFADWIWETHIAEGPASYGSTDPLYDADAAKWGRVVLFKKEFSIPGNPTSATLHIAADNAYEFWLNTGTSTRSATAKLDGWETSDLWEDKVATTGWQPVGHYDISTDLSSGLNVLYVLAGNEYFDTDDGNSPVPATQSDPYKQYNPGAVIFRIDIEYEPVQLYDICGYKYAEWWADEDIPLPGWTIQLYAWNATAEDWALNATTTTDENGKYCFTDLLAGNYSVREVLKDGWDQLEPTGNEHIIELPDGATGETGPYYNFLNTPTEYCFDETAWAAQAHPGETRFENASNWATYVEYTTGNGTEQEPAFYPLYAGQYYLAGILYVYDEHGALHVKYTTEIPQWILDHCEEEGGLVYEVEGLCAGDWTGFLEYHLAVGNTTDDIPRTMSRGRGRGRNPGTLTNPIPGHFEYSDYFDPAEPETEWIEVDIEGLGDSFVIAAHAVMQWCGYDCEAVDEVQQVLHLVSKNPSTWEVIEGASGVLLFAPQGSAFNFVFDAAGLQASTDYSLIYYADPWPGNNPGALIALGTTDGDGFLHLDGAPDLGMDLPAPADANYPTGAKIWLVPSLDYDAGNSKMIAWAPTHYLFEYNLITYNDTDVS